MRNINIALSDEEYRKVISQKGDMTHKQAFLKGLGISYQRPPLGRPTMDEARKSWEERAREQREADAQMHLDAIKKKYGETDHRAILNDTFNEAQRKRKEG